MALSRGFAPSGLLVGVGVVLLATMVAIAPSPLVAQEPAKKPGASAGNEADQAAAESVARRALVRLTELGADTSRLHRIGIGNHWKGTAADLALLNDLVDLEVLHFDFAGLDAELVGQLTLARPVKHLILAQPTDAQLARLDRLPSCLCLRLSPHRLSSAGIQRLAVLAHGIEDLSLQGSQDGIDDEGLKAIGQMRSLKALDLNSLKITDAGLAHLAALDKLENLRLSSYRPLQHPGGAAEYHMDGSGFAGLVANQGLRSLLVWDMPFDPVAFRAVAELIQLETLVLGYNATQFEIGPDEVELLRNLTNLRTLELYAGGRRFDRDLAFGDIVLDSARQMPKLRRLFLDSIDTSDRGIELLAKGTHLEDLFLDSIPITERNVAALQRLKHLKNLGLGGREVVTVAGLEKLAEVPQLTRLSLSLAKLGETDLSALANLKQLKSLDVSRTSFGDQHCEILRSLVALEELDMNDTKITDRALNSLAMPANLRRLLVDDTAVTIAGVLKLAPQLKNLNVLSIDKISASPEEHQQLFAALPGAGIVYSPGPGTRSWIAPRR